MKLRGLLILFGLLVVMSACSDGNLNFSQDVAYIEVSDFEGDALVDVIHDEEFIDLLVKKLDKAQTASTANLDFELPEYRIFLKSESDETLLELGYYKEVVNLGVKGQYWDPEAEVMYQLALDLPNGLK